MYAGLGGSSSADLVRMRLTANGVIAHDGAWEGGNEGGSAAGCPAFESFSGAVQWCEAHFMKVRSSVQHCISLIVGQSRWIFGHCPEN